MRKLIKPIGWRAVRAARGTGGAARLGKEIVDLRFEGLRYGEEEEEDQRGEEGDEQLLDRAWRTAGREGRAKRKVSTGGVAHGATRST